MMANILEPIRPEIVMPAYDGLPPAVRAAIAGADFPYDPRIVAEWLNGGARETRIIADIARFDRRPQPWW